MQPIKFGFQGGAIERMSGGDAYLLRLPNFIDVGISHDCTFMVWKYTHPFINGESADMDISFSLAKRTELAKRIQIENLLQALGIIYDLILKHGRYEFLPDGIREYHLTHKGKEEENPHAGL